MRLLVEVSQPEGELTSPSFLSMKSFLNIFLLLIFILPLNLVPTTWASGELIITEVMYDLPGSDDGREWVEIYNPSNSPVSIIMSGSGSWRFNDSQPHLLRLVQGDPVIPAQDLIVIAVSSTIFLQEHQSFSGTLLTSSFSLSNNGATIGLSSDGGQTWLTQLTYERSWGGAGNGKSLEKIDPLGLDDMTNWHDANFDGGTPGQLPTTSPPPTNQPPVANAGLDQQGLINQPISFNGDQSVDPNGDTLTFNWNFGDGISADGVAVTHGYSQSGIFTVTLTVSDGQLSSSDTAIVTINDNNGEQENRSPVADAGPDQSGIVGQLFTFDGSGSWDEDSDPLTFLWLLDNNVITSGSAATYNFNTAGVYEIVLEVNDGQVTTTDSLQVTVNSISQGGGGYQPPPESPKIIINELLPNPIGDDQEGEFIELHNLGFSTVNLQGWVLQDDSARQYKIDISDFDELTIQPGGWFVIPRIKSEVTLNNTNDELRLFRPDQTLADVVGYSQSQEGMSWSRQNNNEWRWATPSPGAINVSPVNRSPKAVIKVITPSASRMVDQSISFDGQSSTDPDGDALTFSWDFGDQTISAESQPTHIYEQTGRFLVKLMVIDSSGLNAVATTTISVTSTTSDLSLNKNISSSRVLGATSSSDISQLLISEFLPNPQGDDINEWIELFNDSEAPVDLAGFILDDAADGSLPFTFSTSTIIQPKQYLTLNRGLTKLSLNNDQDEVRLLTSAGQVVDQVAYQKALEGSSYSLDMATNSWQWATPSPGQPNIAVSPAQIYQSPLTSQTVFNQEIGQLVSMVGMVSMPGGVAGKKLFYVLNYDPQLKTADVHNGLGIQITAGDVPQLLIGDVVEIKGTVAMVNEEMRIKVNKDGQIKIIDHQSPPPAATKQLGELNSSLSGGLIEVSGEVIESNGRNIVIDDGTGELKVSFPTTIPKPKVKTGQYLSAVGVLQNYNSGLRLMPVTGQDVSLVTDNQVTTTSTQTSSSVWSIVVGDQLKTKMIMGLAAISLLLAGLIWWLRRRGQH